jgi:AraC-like DNA-binding protein
MSKTLSDLGFSFSITEKSGKLFDMVLHKHPHYEIMYIEKGKGIRFVGDDRAKFNIEDLVLLGIGLPHCWKNDVLPYEDSSASKVSYINIHFDHDFLGNDFFDKPELSQIQKLLWQSSFGIAFLGREKKIIIEEIKKLRSSESVDRVIGLLSILKKMSSYRHKKLLASPGYVEYYSVDDQDQLIKVKKYIHENFKNELHLDELAGLTGLTKTSFCRYFKKLMNKTVFTYITEVRIGYACKLLKNTDWQVSQICYECGYANHSNFYRQFKSIKNMAPMEYRHEIEKAQKGEIISLNEITNR